MLCVMCAAYAEFVEKSSHQQMMKRADPAAWHQKFNQTAVERIFVGRAAQVTGDCMVLRGDHGI